MISVNKTVEDFEPFALNIDKNFKAYASKKGQPLDFKEGMVDHTTSNRADRATSKGGRLRNFKEGTANRATSKRGRQTTQLQRPATTSETYYDFRAIGF